MWYRDGHYDGWGTRRYYWDNKYTWRQQGWRRWYGWRDHEQAEGYYYYDHNGFWRCPQRKKNFGETKYAVNGLETKYVEKAIAEEYTIKEDIMKKLEAHITNVIDEKFRQVEDKLAKIEQDAKNKLMKILAKKCEEVEDVVKDLETKMDAKVFKLNNGKAEYGRALENTMNDMVNIMNKKHKNINDKLAKHFRSSEENTKDLEKQMTGDMKKLEANVEADMGLLHELDTKFEKKLDNLEKLFKCEFIQVLMKTEWLEKNFCKYKGKG